MIKLNSLFIVIVCAVLFISCEKEEEGIKVPMSTLLAGTESKAWIITEYTVNGEDFFNLQEDCSKDNLHLFQINGVLDISEGEIKCNPDADDHLRTSSWSIDEGKSEFTWGVVYQITSITENKFVFEHSDPQSKYVFVMESVN